MNGRRIIKIRCRRNVRLRRWQLPQGRPEDQRHWIRRVGVEVRVGRGMQNWRRMAGRMIRMDMDTPTRMRSAIRETMATRRRQDDPLSSARHTKTTAGCSPSECPTSTATLTTCLTFTTNRSLRDLHSIPCQTLRLRQCRRSSSTLSYSTDPPLLGICRCTLRHITRCRIRTARITFIFRRRQACPLPISRQASMLSPSGIHQHLEAKVPLQDTYCQNHISIRTTIIQVRR